VKEKKGKLRVIVSEDVSSVNIPTCESEPCSNTDLSEIEGLAKEDLVEIEIPSKKEIDSSKLRKTSLDVSSNKLIEQPGNDQSLTSEHNLSKTQVYKIQKLYE
jgi:hypothetical protein